MLVDNYILTTNGSFKRVESDELLHYGVKGMKWGVRRYQNSDGTVTAADRKKARQEYRADNKEAYKLGKEATLYGRAAAYSINRTVSLENKLNKRYAKNPDSNTRRTASLNKKLNASSKTTADLTKKYMESKDKAEKHCKSLIDKYGDEAVSSIKYTDVKVKSGKHGSPTKFNTMNERTSDLSDYAKAGAMSMASVAIATLLGSPYAVVSYRKTTAQQAYDIERATYRANKKNLNG